MPILANARLIAQIHRRTDDEFYGDTALLLIDIDSGTVDEFNNPVVTTQNVPIECSFHELSSREQWRNYGDLGIAEAEIRFIAPTPTKGNRVQVTSRFGGTPIPSKVYDIVSIDNRAVLGFLCSLKAVEL